MTIDTSQSTDAPEICKRSLTLRALPALPAIVLDTNVVLDWLLFGDPSVAPLSAAIEQRRVQWVATARMRGELVDVMRRGLAVARGVDTGTVLAAWDTHVDPRDAPPAMPQGIALQCTDGDDQMFLDLAHAAGARWLVSRDRAVLRLARRAAALGLAITTPDRWVAPT